MNAEKLTDRSQGFIQNAQSLAARYNNQFLMPEHLLKAMLDDKEGMAASLISQTGIDVDNVKRQIEDDINRLNQYLIDFNCDFSLNTKVKYLSGGEKQRLSILRAYLKGGDIFLLDEPTGNLDPQTSEKVFAELLSVVRETGLSALIATHNPALAAKMDRQIHIENGIVVEE